MLAALLRQEPPAVGPEQLQAKVSLGKSMSGSCLQVCLKLLRQTERFKGDVKLDLPREEFGGVRAFAGVMLSKPLFEVSCVAAVELIRMRDTLENIGVKHIILPFIP